MSDATSAEMFARGGDFLARHRREYLTSGGTRGHILDLRDNGGLAFSPHLLLAYVGRKSGKRYINPLFYGAVGGEVVIIASKGGADHHPEWYLNLVSRPDVRFQIGTQAFRGTWREPEGDERAYVWDFMVRNNPSFACYQSTTTRRIPVVLLKETEEIAVFTEDDCDA